MAVSFIYIFITKPQCRMIISQWLRKMDIKIVGEVGRTLLRCTSFKLNYCRYGILLSGNNNNCIGSTITITTPGASGLFLSCGLFCSCGLFNISRYKPLILNGS